MHNDVLASGFIRHFKKSKFTDPWEPLYSKVLQDRVQLGVFLSEEHCNSRGFVHGGLIATLSDNAMGLSCAENSKNSSGEIKGLVTITLSVDYMGLAKLGEFLLIDTDYVRCGRSICFARAMISSSSVPVAKASATFKVFDK